MQLISAHAGKLIRLREQEATAAHVARVTTGLDALDAVLPPDGLRRGAIHELLHSPQHPQPRFIAASLGIADCRLPIAEQKTSGFGNRQSTIDNPIIWFDPDHTLYPPALAAMGIDLARLYIIRPRTYADLLWALTECLRCTAVSATVCPVDRLSRVEARKLQLAIETGGGIGLLFRPNNSNAQIYAAATRWLIEPAAGERSLQRWKMQLLHGHGGRVGSVIYLEHDRETHLLRAVDPLAGGSGRKETIKIAG